MPAKAASLPKKKKKSPPLTLQPPAIPPFSEPQGLSHASTPSSLFATLLLCVPFTSPPAAAGWLRTIRDSSLSSLAQGLALSRRFVSFIVQINVYFFFLWQSLSRF